MEAANANSNKRLALELLAGCSNEVNCIYRGMKLLPFLFDGKAMAKGAKKTKE